MLKYILFGLLVLVLFEAITCYDDDEESEEEEDEDDYAPTTKKPRLLYYKLVKVNRHNYNQLVPPDPTSWFRTEQTLTQCLDLFEKCFHKKEGYKHNDGKIDWDCRSTPGCEDFPLCTEDMIEEKGTDCAPEIGDKCVRKLTDFNRKFRPCFKRDLEKAFPGCDISSKPEHVVKPKMRSIRQTCKLQSVK